MPVSARCAYAWKASLALACMMGGAGSVGAQSSSPEPQGEGFLKDLTLQKGVDYLDLNPPVATVQDRIEVIFFYRYTDPGLADAMSLWRRWMEEGNPQLRLQGSPGVFSDTDGVTARAFFALADMGLEPKVSPYVADAIHKNTLAPLDLKSWGDWLGAQKIDVAAFQKAINSSTVIGQTAAVPQIMRMYGVTRTPTVVVRGRYSLSTNGSTTAEQLMLKAYTLAGQIRDGKVAP